MPGGCGHHPRLAFARWTLRLLQLQNLSGDVTENRRFQNEYHGKRAALGAPGVKNHPRIGVPICGKVLLTSVLLGYRMAESPTRTQAPEQMRPSDAIARNGFNPASTGAEHEHDDERLRGIVTLPHTRNVLFTDEVELDRDSLPRWRPQITLELRRLTDDDHD